MAMIGPEHAEWAVVERLRAMLVDEPHRKFNVTQSYGLCCSILAWVMQRIRTPDNMADSQEAKAAIKLRKSLSTENVESLPWGLKTEQEGDADAADFRGWKAFDFLVWLRNGLCHGDSRQITPINDGNKLIGFRVTAAGKNDQTRTILLHEEDFRRIGGSLASFYCRALENASGDEFFSKDAKSIKEQRKSA